MIAMRHFLLPLRLIGLIDSAGTKHPRAVAEIDTCASGCTNYSRARTREEAEAERRFRHVRSSLRALIPFYKQQPVTLPSNYARGLSRMVLPLIWISGGRIQEGELAVLKATINTSADEPRVLDGAVSNEHQRRSERFGGSACLDARPLIDRLVTEPWNIYGLSLLLSRPLPLRRSENWSLRDRSSGVFLGASRDRAVESHLFHCGFAFASQKARLIQSEAFLLLLVGGRKRGAISARYLVLERGEVFSSSRFSIRAKNRSRLRRHRHRGHLATRCVAFSSHSSVILCPLISLSAFPADDSRQTRFSRGLTIV